MNLREENYNNIHKYRPLSFLPPRAEWYVNVKDWKEDYISVTSSLKAVGRNLFFMGTSTVDVEVVGSSGTFSEQTFKYYPKPSSKLVYSFPDDMYVGNSNKITISSVGGQIYFNTGKAIAQLNGSKTFSR